MNIATITRNLDNFLELLFFGAPITKGPGLPDPPAKVSVKQPAKQEKQDDEWKRAFSVPIKENGKVFAVNVDTKTDFTDDGLVSFVRTSHGAKVVLSTELTDLDIVELQRRNIATKAGKHLKQFFAMNPLMSATELEMANEKYKIRTCEGALAAFRAAAGVE